MNLAPVEAIVKTVLYEGYILYPYRASNVKNRQRWTFGGVYPRQEESLACGVQTECLVPGSPEFGHRSSCAISASMRREVGEFASPMTELPAGQEPAYTNVASLKVGEEFSQSLEEAVERDVTTPVSDAKAAHRCARKGAIRLCRAAKFEALARAGRLRVRYAHSHQR